MKIHEFISMIAGCETSDELDEDTFVAEDAVETMDRLIDLARTLSQEKVPTSNFVEGDWSFRYSVTSGRHGFSLFPKGQRSHWLSRGSMNVASDGRTWMYTVFHNGSGVADARPSFAEAKAEVLRLLARPER